MIWNIILLLSVSLQLSLKQEGKMASHSGRQRKRNIDGGEYTRYSDHTHSGQDNTNKDILDSFNQSKLEVGLIIFHNLYYIPVGPLNLRIPTHNLGNIVIQFSSAWQSIPNSMNELYAVTYILTKQVLSFVCQTSCIWQQNLKLKSQPSYPKLVLPTPTK